MLDRKGGTQEIVLLHCTSLPSQAGNNSYKSSFPSGSQRIFQSARKVPQ